MMLLLLAAEPRGALVASIMIQPATFAIVLSTAAVL